ncbi:MAG: four helix bundle protein [Phycisphaerales bacterium]|nr:four helix bundle protein [Phycisphaerales bacterium]
MGRAIRTFRDLIIWERGMELVKLAYQFSNRLPSEENFGLKSQLRRAATSVPLNVAEGYGLGSPDQFLRHLRIARASCMEVDTAVEIAAGLYGLVPDDQLIEMIAETDRVLQGFIRSIERRKAADKSPPGAR